MTLKTALMHQKLDRTSSVYLLLWYPACHARPSHIRHSIIQSMLLAGGHPGNVCNALLICLGRPLHPMELHSLNFQAVILIQ